MKSKLYRINIYDFIKGLIIAILTPMLLEMQSYLSTGKLDIKIESIFAVGFSGLIAYLIKNFFTNNK